MLGAGVLAGFLVLPAAWAVAFAVVVVVNLVLMYVGPLRPRGRLVASARPGRHANVAEVAQ